MTPATAAKSVSVEETYEQDISGLDAIHRELLRHADTLADRLRSTGVAARTVTLKVRFADFTTTTRSETLTTPTDVARDLYRVARILLASAIPEERSIRLIGLGASSLVSADSPRQLAVDRPAKWGDLADTVGEVRSRYGTASIRPARLADDRDRPPRY